MLSQPNKSKAVISYLPIALLLFTQLADGVLTYAAISKFGLEIEGNPFVRDLIWLFGTKFGLVGAKSLGMMCGISLHLAGIHSVVMGLTVFYVYAALLPWSFVLATFP